MKPTFSAKCSFLQEEDNKTTEDAHFLHTGEGPSSLLDLSLVIVVADAVTIYSVYNSDVMYKRGRKPLQIFA